MVVPMPMPLANESGYRKIYSDKTGSAGRIVNMGMANRTADRQTQAISIVTAEELEKNATPNSFNALYGLVPGLEVMQRTGWTQNPTTLLRGSIIP